MEMKFVNPIYGAGITGQAVKTDILIDCKKRYVIIHDIIKKMDGA